MKTSYFLLLMLLAAAAGFFVHQYYWQQDTYLKISFPDIDSGLVNPIQPGQQYGCRTVAEALAWENRLGVDTGPVATAESKPSTEVFAFKIGDDGKSISVLGASEVAYGISDAQETPIVSLTGNTIVATRTKPLGVTSIILDTKTLKAILSNTSRGLGVGAHSFLLQCQ